MKLIAIPSGPIETNAWLLVNEENKSALLFDAPPMSYDLIMEHVEKENCLLKAVIITHGHWDHMLDAYRFAEAGIPLYGHKDSKPFMEHPESMSAYAMPGLHWIGASLTENVEDLQSMELAGFDLKFRSSAGHCPGSILIVIDALKSVIVGDVIFRGSIGRTDLPGGSFEELSDNIRKKIYSLPDTYTLCPGHGPTTTVSFEKGNNPFVRGEV